MIVAKNIQKFFGDLQVLKGVDLVIKKGEIVSIVGASGAGKTTLLQILKNWQNLEINTLALFFNFINCFQNLLL